MVNMFLSDEEIANLSCSHVGAGAFQTFEEDSPEATECKRWFEFARRRTLKVYDWSFARKRGTLTLLAIPTDDVLEDAYAYRYGYPADCLAFRRVWNPNGIRADAIPFEVETMDSTGNRTVLTNMEDAIGLWTFNQLATDQYSELFIEGLSYILGAYIAFPLTGKQKLSATMKEAAAATLRAAAAEDANQHVDHAPRDVDWISVRTDIMPFGASPSWRAFDDADN